MRVARENAKNIVWSIGYNVTVGKVIGRNLSGDLIKSNCRF